MMNDLSKRLRKMAERDDRRDLLGVIPGILREAADALDARWQTMESAPREVPLLLLPFDGHASIGTLRDDGAGRAYVEAEDGFGLGDTDIFTHWHPLPPPPE
jgi:hypothetical protein